MIMLLTWMRAYSAALTSRQARYTRLKSACMACIGLLLCGLTCVPRCTAEALGGC